MTGLKPVIATAAAAQKAIGHFNVSNLEMLWGVFQAARSLDQPVIVGVSEGEREAIGVRQIAALIKSLRAEYNFPIFLNADHTTSFDRAKTAIDAGFDAVLIDGSALPIAENLKLVKTVVAYAQAENPEISVEGELGFIGKSSQVLTAIPAGVDLKNLTTPAEAEEFVVATGVNLFAPAVGNIHGLLAGRTDPPLDLDLIKQIRIAAKVPLVLHGASGNTAADLRAAIAAGVAVVHISTELRLAWRDAVKLSLTAEPDEVTPYKLVKPALQAVERVVEKKLRLFSNLLE